MVSVVPLPSVSSHANSSRRIHPPNCQLGEKLEVPLVLLIDFPLVGGNFS